MRADHKLARAANRLLSQTTSDSICFSCQRTLLRRHYASAATAAVARDDTPRSASRSDTTAPTSLVRSLRPAYQLKAGIVLSRPPQITRDLTPFEKAFYFYQRRLNERLALPFTRYFYYKKGTPADVEWKRKVKERLTPARDVGVYNAYGTHGWNDEVLLGANESETEDQMEKLLRDAETPTAAESTGGAAMEAAQAKREEVERPMGRITEADRTEDVRSLDRLLQKSLYLLVKGEGGRWTFPSVRLLDKENLHQAAERLIVHAGGPNMNTWVVGNAPVGHYMFNFAKALENTERGTRDLGEKIFFMKGRIMAGQANLKDNKLGLEDFRWLAKEEIQKVVTPKYWSMTQAMLEDR